MKYTIILFLTTLVFGCQAQDSLVIREDLELMMDGFLAHEEMKLGSFIGMPSPVFTKTDIDGVEHWLELYQGKVVVLFFWNSYDERCLEQLASINQIVKDHKQNEVIVLSFIDDKPAEITEYISRFMQSDPPLFPIIADSYTFSRKTFGDAIQLPKVFVLDKLHYVQMAFSNANQNKPIEVYDKVKPIIEDLLKMWACCHFFT